MNLLLFNVNDAYSKWSFMKIEIEWILRNSYKPVLSFCVDLKRV